MPTQRDAVQQKITEALIESRAVDFAALSKVISDHAEEAMRSGFDLALIIGKFNHYACGYPGPLVTSVIERPRIIERQALEAPNQVIEQ